MLALLPAVALGSVHHPLAWSVGGGAVPMMRLGSSALCVTLSGRSARMSMPDDEPQDADQPDEIGDLLADMNAADDTAAEGMLDESVGLDLAELKQSLSSIARDVGAVDEQRWKAAFGEDLTLSDIDKVGEEEDEGFEEGGTF